MKKIMLMICAVTMSLVLAGCNGDDGAGTGDFMSQIRQMVSTAPENSEPLSVESTAVSTPEQTAPEPL